MKTVAVAAIAREVGDFVGNVLAFDHFAEYGVLAGEPVGIGDRDEELRSICIWTGIGHGEFAGFVETVGRTLRFILELVTGAAGTGTLGISALNHEIGNYAVKNGSVIEGVFALLARAGMSPLALTFRQFDEIGDGFRGILLKQTANNVAFRGVENCIHARRSCHIFPRVSRS